MTKLDGEGAEKTAPPLISQDNPGKPDALTLSSATEQNGNWKTAESAGNPALCRTFGPDARIVAELAHVRRINRLFPPPRRGLMYFDFKANRVAIDEVRP